MSQLFSPSVVQTEKVKSFLIYKNVKLAVTGLVRARRAIVQAVKKCKKTKLRSASLRKQTRKHKNKKLKHARNHMQHKPTSNIVYRLLVRRASLQNTTGSVFTSSPQPLHEIVSCKLQMVAHGWKTTFFFSSLMKM